jgi:hypothetical protein
MSEVRLGPGQRPEAADPQRGLLASDLIDSSGFLQRLHVGRERKAGTRGMQGIPTVCDQRV